MRRKTLSLQQKESSIALFSFFCHFEGIQKLRLAVEYFKNSAAKTSAGVSEKMFQTKKPTAKAINQSNCPSFDTKAFYYLHAAFSLLSPTCCGALLVLPVSNHEY